MKTVVLSTCAVVCLLGAGTFAQDTVEKNTLKVDVDDAHTAVMTGCLVQQPGGGVMLVGAASSVGKDLKIESKTKTDVDGDDVKVTSKSEAKLDDAKKSVGTSGSVASYVVTPRTGVDLQSHVGHQVEITAVVVDPKKGGDDDAKVKIEDKTKVDPDHGPDGKAQTTTKLELPRGSEPVLMAVSIKTLGATCR